MCLSSLFIVVFCKFIMCYFFFVFSFKQVFGCLEDRILKPSPRIDEHSAPRAREAGCEAGRWLLTGELYIYIYIYIYTHMHTHVCISFRHRCHIVRDIRSSCNLCREMVRLYLQLQIRSWISVDETSVQGYDKRCKRRCCDHCRRALRTRQGKRAIAVPVAVMAVVDKACFCLFCYMCVYIYIYIYIYIYFLSLSLYLSLSIYIYIHTVIVMFCRFWQLWTTHVACCSRPSLRRSPRRAPRG